MGEARLEDVGSGLAPVTDGWFVVGVAAAAWLENDDFGRRCVFEASRPVVRDREDLEPRTFPDLGVTLAVLRPGRPSGLYHREEQQEDFLVLRGVCLLLVDGEERRLQAWDFVHCPPGTAHAFVGLGEGPCVLLMVGARRGGGLFYPRDEIAVDRDAAAGEETASPREAYARRAHWRPGQLGDGSWLQ